MFRPTLIRMYAAGAFLAGALRAISSFIPESTPHVYLLYFVIDVGLLFGVIVFYRFWIPASNVVTVLAFILMFVALIVLIARDVRVISSGVYAVAAATFSLGIDLFAIEMLRRRRMSRWIPVAWLLSAVLGPVGFFVPRLHFFFAISGLIFGTAFAGAGVVIWRLSSRTQLT